MNFILGLAFGYGIGLVIAPASGEETRRHLWQRAEEAGLDPRQAALRVTENAEEKAGEMGERIGRRVGEATVEAIRDEIRESGKQSA